MFPFAPYLNRLLQPGKVIAATVLGFLALQVYLALLPTRPNYTKRQQLLVQQASGHAADWVQQLTVESGLAVFGNLERDPFGFVSLPIRDAVWRTDRFNLKDRGFTEKLRERLLWDLPTYSPDGTLLEFARESEAQYALGGVVETLSDDTRQARLKLRLTLWDVSANRRVAEKSLLISDPPLHARFPLDAAAMFETFEATGALPARILGWFAVCFALPMLFLLRRSLLTEAGNSFLLATLLSLILLSGLLAHYWVASGLGTFWHSALLLVLITVSTIYHWNALAFLREKLG